MNDKLGFNVTFFIITIAKTTTAVNSCIITINTAVTIVTDFNFSEYVYCQRNNSWLLVFQCFGLS